MVLPRRTFVPRHFSLFFFTSFSLLLPIWLPFGGLCHPPWICFSLPLFHSLYIHINGDFSSSIFLPLYPDLCSFAVSPPLSVDNLTFPSAKYIVVTGPCIQPRNRFGFVKVERTGENRSSPYKKRQTKKKERREGRRKPWAFLEGSLSFPSVAFVLVILIRFLRSFLGNGPRIKIAFDEILHRAALNYDRRDTTTTTTSHSFVNTIYLAFP